MRPALWFVAIAAMTACQPQGGAELQPEPKPTGTSTGSGTGTGTGTPTGTTTGTTSGTATGSTTTDFDCTQLPPLPLTEYDIEIHHDYSDAEDFDFDGDGFAVALYNGNLIGKDQAATIKVVASNVATEGAGTRILKTGDFVVANVWSGELVLVDAATGGRTTLMGGFSYPNGVEVDADDNVYATDQDRGLLIRVNAYDPADNEVISAGLSNPNGVIMSADGQHIYVGTFGGGVIYAIDSDGAGGWLPKRIFYDDPGQDFGFDGINVDICGNVYFTEWIVGMVRRITPDGQTIEPVADLPSSWIPNLRWGNDVGGWSNDVLYVSDRDQGRLFGLKLGIPGKPPLVP